MKLTKRKQFNFFRSYYDVYNELTTDKDKIAFIEALLDREFLGIKPIHLTGMAKFAYISQTNSIDSQVKGWEDKTGRELHTPTEGGTQGGSDTPTVQEKGKEKGKGEYKEVKTSNLFDGLTSKPKKAVDYIDYDKLLLIFNKTLGKNARIVPPKAKAQLKARLKEGYSKSDLVKVIENAAADPFHKESSYKNITLEFITRPDKFERFVNMGDFKIVEKRV